MSTSSTTKQVHSLVLDAGPIIKNEPPVSTLIAQAETLFTIPAVVDEIRDAVTRARVETTLLPFLTLRQPKPASVKVITDFARRTGDLEVLSKPDIQLMALAYELECERNHGDWRLRSLPGQKRLNGAPPTSISDESTKLPVEAPEPTATAVPAKDTRGAWGTAIPSESEVELHDIMKEEQGASTVAQQLEATHISEDPLATAEQAPVASDEVEASVAQEAALSPESHDSVDGLDVPQDGEATTVEAEEDDSDGEWITPSNLKEHQAKDANGSAEPQKEVKVMQAAIITSDFAMQNVLLRMNINLLSPSLQRIQQLKTWVLRCHACFHIEKDMAKQFCGKCGKNTLLRTSCSTDKDGNFKVHLKKNMQWNTRGNVYSIPKPVAGSSNGKRVEGGGKGGWGQGLILAEDQKEYVRAMQGERRKKEKDLMDEDYLPGILSGDRGRAGGRPKVGAGKAVNARKRR
ncbi:hypothetical protein BP5796_00914 [Coleophoma crateriformis]|uniref:20S-pre-rRNA D-site endonuclease NOB1 n=1 Tax=Coleophoma crateriformis TaxID=565419 RepID=A0A3D8T9P7_9HELO|nr:hypothetical protein BP5796_00914 [Coleophoma crateriformis]